MRMHCRPRRQKAMIVHPGDVIRPGHEAVSGQPRDEAAVDLPKLRDPAVGPRNRPRDGAQRDPGVLGIVARTRAGAAKVEAVSLLVPRTRCRERGRWLEQVGVGDESGTGARPPAEGEDVLWLIRRDCIAEMDGDVVEEKSRVPLRAGVDGRREHAPARPQPPHLLGAGEVDRERPATSLAIVGPTGELRRSDAPHERRRDRGATAHDAPERFHAGRRADGRCGAGGGRVGPPHRRQS